MALVEGVKYGLSNAENCYHSSSYKNLTSLSANSMNNGGGGANNGGTNKKSVIFVKLTDSALKAIEDYLHQQKSQQKTGDRATLQFLGSDGRIHIPSSNPNAKSGHSFDFSLSSNADIEGPQGSFECIKQTGSSSLECMGTLPFKMRIHAKDDVYEATKHRISVLEQNRQHECAKEIKPNNADIGRKVKTKFSKHPQRHESSHNNFSSHKKPSLLQSSSLTNNNRISNNYTNHNHSNSGLNHNSQPGQYSQQHRLNNNDTNNQIKHNYYATSGGIPPKYNGPSTTGGGDISRKPLRDRIIHLLAVKPYKKPELISRLMKEGVKQKDKNLIMGVVVSVSTMKGNEYFLNRGIWNDVQEFWPFYTEEERQAMKRRKPQNLTPPGSDCSIGSGTSGSSLSPPSSTFGHCSPPSSFSTSHYGPLPAGVLPYNNANSTGLHLVKRTADSIDDEDDSIPTKRQRISHFSRESLTNKKEEIVMKPDIGDDSIITDKLDCDSFLDKYTAIRTAEQRTRYKTDFNNEYEHYRDLHSVIDKVGKRFAQLQEMLNQEEEGSEAYAAVKTQIVNEYHHNKKSRKYQEARRAFSNLHDKLSHIKRLVHDYDLAHSSSSSLTA